MTVPWNATTAWVGTDPWPGPDSAGAKSGTVTGSWTITGSAAGDAHTHLPGLASLAGDGTGLAVLDDQALAVAVIATT